MNVSDHHHVFGCLLHSRRQIYTCTPKERPPQLIYSNTASCRKKKTPSQVAEIRHFMPLTYTLIRSSRASRRNSKACHFSNPSRGHPTSLTHSHPPSDHCNAISFKGETRPENITLHCRLFI